MWRKNRFFGSCARYEDAMIAKIGGNLDNLIVHLVSKGFCSTSKNGFLPAVLVIFFVPYL